MRSLDEIKKISDEALKDVDGEHNKDVCLLIQGALNVELLLDIRSLLIKINQRENRKT